MALVASVGPGGAEVRMSHQRATHSQARHLPAHVAQAHIEGEYLPDGTDQRRIRLFQAEETIGVHLENRISRTNLANYFSTSSLRARTN